MLDIILRNEFKKFSGQDLSDYELTALKDYIEWYGDETWKMEDASTAVLDFLDECYVHHDVYADDFQGTEYTIRDWWEFPFASKDYYDDHKVVSYRGGSTTIYYPKGKCAWCGEEEKVYGQFGRCDSGECFCSDQCKADYKKEHPLAE